MGWKFLSVTVIFAFFFWAQMFPIFAKMILDPEDYFVPNSVFVHNTTVGVTPQMEVVRTIKRPFKARWSATVWRVDGGNLRRVPGCIERQSPIRRYKPDAQLPDAPNLTLDWWLEIPPNRECDLSAGDFIVKTEWDIQWPWMPTVEMISAIDSNIFTVFADEAARDAAQRDER